MNEFKGACTSFDILFDLNLLYLKLR